MNILTVLLTWGCDVTAAVGCRFLPLLAVAILADSNRDVKLFSGYQTQGNMRSLVGLITVVAAASLYLYSLSLYLPAGPRKRSVRSAEAGHVSEEQQLQPGDSLDEEEPSR